MKPRALQTQFVKESYNCMASEGKRHCNTGTKYSGCRGSCWNIWYPNDAPLVDDNDESNGRDKDDENDGSNGRDLRPRCLCHCVLSTNHNWPTLWIFLWSEAGECVFSQCQWMHLKTTALMTDWLHSSASSRLTTVAHTTITWVTINNYLGRNRKSSACAATVLDFMAVCIFVQNWIGECLHLFERSMFWSQ